MRFGPFAPDKAKSGNPDILTVCSGVYPMEDGYRPVGQFVPLFSALPGIPKGAATFTSPLGVSGIIAGNTTTLYRAVSGGWESIGTGYDLANESRWRFAQFGGLAIATNGIDAMQKIDLETNMVTPLGGTPPKFEMLAVVKDFLVGGVRNGKVMHMGWSGINDAEWWTTGQRQADRQIMPTGGRINGILSGEYGVILQRDRICRMDYVGGNTIFEINEVSSNIGCVTVHSVAQWGRIGFFYSDEGWMMWDGQQPTPIGREWVDREFSTQYDVNSWPLMSTAIDPANGVLIISMPDKIWLYSWMFQRWSTVPQVASIVFSGVTKGITIDENYSLDMPEDADIDGVGLTSLDDEIFRGGEPILYLFNSINQLGELRGSPMVATFTGIDIEFNQDDRTKLSKWRTDSDATSGVTLSFLKKQRLGDGGAVSDTGMIRPSGTIPLRVSGRYLRPTVTIDAATPWTYAKGLDPVTGRGR